VPAVAQPIQFDLRFDDGSKVRYPRVGDHTVLLFVRVIGADTDLTNDGMGYSYVSIASRQLAGGAASGAITSGLRAYPFNLVGRDGAGTDFNADGFGDWGSMSTDVSDPAYMFGHVAPNPLAYYAAGSDVGVAVNEHTWEFPLASFSVSVTSVLQDPDGQTELEIIPPSFQTSNFGPYFATYRRDGLTYGLVAPLEGIYGSSVSFAVPEPGTAILVLCSAGALMKRRGWESWAAGR